MPGSCSIQTCPREHTDATRDFYKRTRFEAHLPLLAEQFSKPSAAGLVSDGYSDFFSFSTGRRAIASLHVVFQLIPRHDILQSAYQFIWSCVDLTYSPRDEIQLDFKLFTSQNAPNFVWAVVNKDYLPKIKDSRWDLVCISFTHMLLPAERSLTLISQTFTRTTENAQLGSSFVVMSGGCAFHQSCQKCLRGSHAIRNQSSPT